MLYIYIFVLYIFSVLVVHSSHSFDRDAHLRDNREIGFRNPVYYFSRRKESQNCCFETLLLIDLLLSALHY